MLLSDREERQERLESESSEISQSRDYRGGSRPLAGWGQRKPTAGGFGRDRLIILGDYTSAQLKIVAGRDTLDGESVIRAWTERGLMLR